MEGKTNAILILIVLAIFLAVSKFLILDRMVPESKNGRYQIVFNPHLATETFLLDTKTGRVWKFVKFTDLEGEPELWDAMDIIDNKQAMGFYEYDNKTKQYEKFISGKTFDEFMKNKVKKKVN